MIKFPKTALRECLDEPDFWFVEQDDVTTVPLLVVEDPTVVGDEALPLEDAHTAVEDAHTAPAEQPGNSAGWSSQAVLQAPAEKPRIVSRPQAYNGQDYFSMLHRWAGRSAGGFGRPAGYSGRGTWAKWAHRRIPSVAESGLQVDFDHQVMCLKSG